MGQDHAPLVTPGEISDDVDLLRLMIRDQEAQSGVYQPGRYWTAYARRTARAIEQEGLDRFRAVPSIAKGYADVIIDDPADLWGGDNWKGRLLQRVAHLGVVRRHLLRPYLSKLDAQTTEIQAHKAEIYNARYADDMDELIGGIDIDTTRGGTRDVVDVAGREIASVYLRYAVQIASADRRVALDDVRSVCEVGGGFGASMHLLLERHPNVRKAVYVDIAPILYVGTQYLRSFFGSAVRDYRATRDLAEIRFADDDAREILCLAPWQLERVVADVELFWNSSSFREMDPGQVRLYAAQAKRLGARAILLFAPPIEVGSGLSTSYADVVDAFGPEISFEPLEMDPPDVNGEAAVIGRHANGTARL